MNIDRLKTRFEKYQKAGNLEKMQFCWFREIGQGKQVSR